VTHRGLAVGVMAVLRAPLVLVGTAALCLGLSLLRQTCDTLRRAELQRREIARVRAELLAEGALQAELAGRPTACGDDGAAAELVVRRAEQGWRVDVTAADGRRHAFAWDELPGAAPASLGSGLNVGTGLPGWVQTRQPATAHPFPQLDPEALQRAARAELSAVFARSPSVALLHRATGTDRDDFVCRSGALAAANAAGLVLVPGNLWLEPGAEPVQLSLDHDCVVVVAGNLYLGRSLHVIGSGRLVLATALAGGVPFADVDGNGRRSAGDRVLAEGAGEGPQEGGGNCYLGLGTSPGSLALAAGLVIAGELHAAVASEIAGPLVLAHGVTRLGAAPVQVVAGWQWSFLPHCERVPGFLTQGPPRPGRPRELENRPLLPQQPLYLAEFSR
jgi:hypothetical protein